MSQKIHSNNYEKELLNIISEYPPKIYSVKQQNKNICINFIPMGLDIETSTIYERDDKGKVIEHFSFMYIWQLSVYDHTFIGRTYDDLKIMIDCILKHICSRHYKTIIFIQNQSYEFSFLARFFEKYYELSIFSRKKRHPMKFTINDNIIFLDSYLLTGFNLSKIADVYTNIHKLVGELDYSKIRLPITTMSEQELEYCINDVQILSKYAEYYEKNYLTIGFMPMTSTMIASRVVSKKVKELHVSKEVYQLMQSCYPSSRQEYEYIISFFTGAYTHGMLYNLFQTHENCLKFDVDSEYPYAFMLPEYPIGKFRKLSLQSNSKETINNVLENFACLIDCTFHNIKTKTGVTIFSKNKIISYGNAVWDNGRLYSADFIRVRITQIDIQTADLHYSWDKLVYNDISFAKKGYLPKYFRLSIAELYDAKNQLKEPAKHDENIQIEYMERKKELNGQYGSCVCKLQFTELLYQSGWIEKEKDIDFSKIKISKNKLPQWGVFCTSISRNIILSAVAKLKHGNEKIIKNYLYSDTDSIAVKNKPYVLEIFNKINAERKEYNQKWIEELNLKELFPNTDFSKMGTFDNETYNSKTKQLEPLKRFKTLGSKRYIVEKFDGTIETTVAGMRKKAFIEYCEKNNLDFFQTFDDKLILSYDDADKLTTYYCDDIVTKEVTDYLVNKQKVTSYGYVSLIPTTFGITISDALKLLAVEKGDNLI